MNKWNDVARRWAAPVRNVSDTILIGLNDHQGRLIHPLRRGPLYSGPNVQSQTNEGMEYLRAAGATASRHAMQPRLLIHRMRIGQQHLLYLRAIILLKTESPHLNGDHFHT